MPTGCSLSYVASTVKRMQTASNGINGTARFLRGSAAVGTGLALAVGLTRVGADGARVLRSGAPTKPEEILLPVVSVGALVVILWLAAAVALELVARLPGAVGRCASGIAGLLTPRQVRRLIVALLGLGITAGLAQSASALTARPALTAAVPLPSPNDASPPDLGFGPLPDPGWVPSAPLVRPQPDVRVLSPVPRTDQPVRPAHQVVVHRGDSLWAIAARHLGPDPSEAEIAEAWPAWYAANRHVVGADPDLLLPGQVLSVPSEGDS